MNRIKYCIANWKMYQNIDNVDYFINQLQNYNNEANKKIVICPSSIHIDRVNKINIQDRFDIGAQDCHYENNGAYTGQISVSMLKELNCRYVIIGHSERRTLFMESNELINKKVIQCIKNNLIPIICIGEPIDVNKKNETKKYIENQIVQSLKNISSANITCAICL